MLKIIIENATFTCHEAGQVIDVALVKAEEWLHEGSIICPSCTVGNLTFFHTQHILNSIKYIFFSYFLERCLIPFIIHGPFFKKTPKNGFMKDQLFVPLTRWEI